MGLRLACTKHATGTQDTAVHWLAEEIAADLQNGGRGVVADFIAACIIFMVTTFYIHPGIQIVFVTESELIAIVTFVQEHTLSSQIVA